MKLTKKKSRWIARIIRQKHPVHTWDTGIKITLADLVMLLEAYEPK